MISVFCVRIPHYITLADVKCSHALGLSISTGTIANVVTISYIFILIYLNSKPKYSLAILPGIGI
jgi:hypothetical protein